MMNLHINHPFLFPSLRRRGTSRFKREKGWSAKIKLLFTLLFSAVFYDGITQTTLPYRFHVDSQHVILRWAPNNLSQWKQIFQNGIKIERLELISNRKVTANDFVFNKSKSTFAIASVDKADSLFWNTQFNKNKNTKFIYELLNSKPTGVAPTKNAQAPFGFSLISCDFDSSLANLFGLYFSDKTITPGKTYAYKVTINKSIPEVFAIVTANTNELSSYEKIKQLQGKTYTTKAELTWSIKNLKKDYNAYVVERSADGINFSKINKHPIVPLTTKQTKVDTLQIFNDSLPDMTNYYYYRVKGLTSFGFESGTSEIIKIKGKYILQGFPSVDSTLVIKDSIVQVKISYANTNELNKVKSVLLYRSNKVDKNYALIHEINTGISQTHYYKDLQPERINYYKAAYVSIDNDTAYSYPTLAIIHDVKPPLKPIGLTGKSDKKGRITLHWNPNKEKDLLGYRVYRRNSEFEELVEVTKNILRDTIFIDSVNIKSLTEEIFYSVNAVDSTHNNSIYSEVIKIKLPDLIPPIAPILKSAVVERNGIRLNYIKSSSKDISHHIIYRKEKNDSTGLKIFFANDTSAQLFDTTAMQGNKYFYYLIAFDDDSNLTASNKIFVQNETGIRPKISDFTFSPNQETKKITLNWKCTQPNIWRYTIYKGKTEKELRVYKTVNGSTTTLDDTFGNTGTVFIYKIKAVLTNGAETEMSDGLIIKY